jgi:signal transduction histidine kinase
MRSFKLDNIHSDYASYQQLINLFQENKTAEFEELKLSITTWFDANLCSALGGILDKLQERLITVSFGQINTSSEAIFKKNGFLSYFSYPSLADRYHTTIQFLKLKPTDVRYFYDYIENELLCRSEFPAISSGLKDKIAESIYEIFTNAQIHSETKQIYTCGQFYPKKNLIGFTITDTGIGFKERIRKSYDMEIDAARAIKWAFENMSTTKSDVSGGIGLALLKEFIKLNKGKIEVVSDNGYYKIDSNGEELRNFNGSFPGSCVNVQFNTNDNHSYSLASEVEDDLY